MPKNDQDVYGASKGAVFKTIPKNRTTVSVTTSKAEASLASYVGKWIWLRAITGDITLLLGTQAAMTAGQGYVLKTTADHVDFFVDPADTTVLSHIAGAAVTLEILHD